MKIFRFAAFLAVLSVSAFSAQLKADCDHHHHHHHNDDSSSSSDNTGARGPAGPRGATGAPGATGISAGAIIPFASGTVPVILVSGPTGLIVDAAAVGFGSSVPLPAADFLPTGVNGVINADILASGFAFTVPRDGIVDAFAATFTQTAAVIIGEGAPVATVTATLYQYDADGFVGEFVAIAELDLIPTITGVGTVGQILSNSISGLNLPVETGDRLLVVFSASSVNGATPVATTVTGFASAGISIE